jgi:hypothetical protein
MDHIPTTIDFDPNNKADIIKFHNDAIYHAQVYIAMLSICHRPCGQNMSLIHSLLYDVSKLEKETQWM